MSEGHAEEAEEDFRRETREFEGLSELVVQMLDRYRIDNVFISIFTKDFNPFKSLECRHYELIMSKLKEFLLEVYSALVEFKIFKPENNTLATHRHFDLPVPEETEEEKKRRLRARKDKDFEIHPLVPSKVR